MGSEAWTIDPDPSEPDEVLMSTPCADGVESHSWRLVIDEGFATFRSGCMSCEEFIEDMYGEAYVVAAKGKATTCRVDGCERPIAYPLKGLCTRCASRARTADGRRPSPPSSPSTP